MFKVIFNSIPSREMADMQAFSIVSNANHIGHNSGLSAPLSFRRVVFSSLQFTRISSTLEKTTTELESNLLVEFFKTSAFWRNARSFEPSLGSLSSMAVETIGLNNLIRKRTQLGDSRRWSSWPWKKSIIGKHRWVNHVVW